MSDAERRERRYRRMSTAALLVFVPVAIGAALLALRRGDYYAASQAGLGLFMFSHPFLLSLHPRLYIPQDIRLLYTSFVFCSIIVGSSLYGYSRIPYWDKLLHALSGLLLCAAGLIVCHLLFSGLAGPRRRALYVLFPFLWNLSLAALWEIYEYMLYVLFGVDAVNTLTTGVNDTMQDMIVCLAGGLLFSFSTLRWQKTGRPGFLLRLCVHFFSLRGEELTP